MRPTTIPSSIEGSPSAGSTPIHCTSPRMDRHSRSQTSRCCLRGTEFSDLTSSLTAPGDQTAPSRTRLPAQKVGLDAKVLFRGRILEKTTDVLFAQTPDVRIIRLPSSSSGIVVTSSAEASSKSSPAGAIAVVLDASGSMGNSENRPEKSKYLEAIEALRQVLSRLPEGTRISVWVFGQAVGEGRTVDAERAMECMLTPIAWRTDLLPGLLSKLTALRPWNKSAVVRAMLQAAQDLEGVDGYRALVLLTDGEDNRWLSDVEANPQKLDVAQAIRARFDQSEIAVHVIGYRVSDGQQRDRTQAQFQVVTQLKTPGSFLLADEVGAPAEKIGRSMPRSVNYRVLTTDNRPLPTLPPAGIPARPARQGRSAFESRSRRISVSGFRERTILQESSSSIQVAGRFSRPSPAQTPQEWK